MKRLSELEAPALAGVVKEKRRLDAVAEIKNCMYDGADMIDLHLSCLESTDVEELRKIISTSKLPILALNYNGTYEGTDAGFDEEARVASLLRAVEAGAAGIDMQGYTFDLPSKTAFCGEDIYSFTKDNPREIVTDAAIISKQCELIEKVHSMGAEILLSCHPNVVMSSDQVVELALFLEKRKPDIIKIVTKATCEDDLAESIRAMLLLKKELKTPVAYHANGKPGVASRIINPLLGGQIAFCVERYTALSDMDQVSLRGARAMVDNMRKMM